MTLELHATPEEVMRAVEAFQEFARAQRTPENVIFGLALALEESASNIVNHALRRDSRQTFQVTIGCTRNELLVELRDRGPEFDPSATTERRSTMEDDELPGGWGIQLARRHTDEFRYRREGEENVLRLTKRLTTTPEGTQTSKQPQSSDHQPPAINHQPHMPLEIQVLKNVDPQHAGSVTVKLNGSLDTATAPELERQLVPVLGAPIKDLVFDLAQLKFISSAGLRIFSTARKQLKERGGQASFVNMQPQIKEVFEIIKALPGVAVFESVAELDRYLARRQRAHEENR
jgi:anti-sigma B factor antagonist